MSFFKNLFRSDSDDEETAASTSAKWRCSSTEIAIHSHVWIQGRSGRTDASWAVARVPENHPKAGPPRRGEAPKTAAPDLWCSQELHVKTTEMVACLSSIIATCEEDGADLQTLMRDPTDFLGVLSRRLVVDCQQVLSLG